MTTVTSFTQKILSIYPDATAINVYACQPTHRKRFDTWILRVANIKVLVNNKTIKLPTEHYSTILDDGNRLILGKNNKHRQIKPAHTYRIIIDTELKTFVTNTNETVKYYPTEAIDLTNPDVIKRIAESQETFRAELWKQYKNNPSTHKPKQQRKIYISKAVLQYFESDSSDIPDFDSD